MKIAQEIADSDKNTLSRLLSQANTGALIDAYELCFEISGRPARNDCGSEVLVALRKELVTRGLEPAPVGEPDARANFRPRRRH